jgi:hypothetical protein
MMSSHFNFDYDLVCIHLPLKSPSLLLPSLVLLPIAYSCRTFCMHWYLIERLCHPRGCT